ncbi:MAG: FAD-dependent oxidoreductase, partial [Actinobacteria bacterium]|nr:FAD-dependent oxidoreductase [Actinomycetota bacterium]
RNGNEYRETYDKLIYSPGAKPTIPDLPGVDYDRIFTLRTIDDTFAIDEYIRDANAETATVIGAGFIGLEMAENLKRRGLHVSVVQRSDHVLPTLDYDMACEVHHYLKDQGIDLYLNTPFEGFSEHEGQIVTRFAGGESLASDLVILAIGVTCDTDLAQNAGLEMGAKNSIRVNERMETSAPDVYAVGDAIEITHYVSGKPGLIALAGPANKQGHIAADNICGIPSAFTGTQGSWVLKIFDMTIAGTGLTEKAAKAAGIDYDRIILSPASHATYYPGAHSITMKVLFAPESGLILGAQLVGFEGVDKRCDVLATAIRAKMTAHDLVELELAYAPPYSSAKDPVNMAGYIMENILNGRISQFHWDEVAQLEARLETRDDITLLDVRTVNEFSRGHFNGAVNIPVDELRDHIHELNPEKPLYVSCQSGLRSYIACSILQQYGYTCYNLSGGYRFYHAIDENAKLSWNVSNACGIDIK